MRVPIYPDDLLPQAAFKRLAKNIQKRWLGQSAITLSLARETLSVGLGYVDYRQVRHLSLTCSQNAQTPSEADVYVSIASALSTVLESAADSSVQPSALESFVKTLPLKALSTFKMVKGEEDQSLDPRAEKVAVTQDQPRSVNFRVPERVPSTSVAATIRVKKTKNLESPLRSMSQDEINGMRRVVEGSANLRDQCIFAMLESGIRGHNFLGAKVSEVTDLAVGSPSPAAAMKSGLPLVGNNAEVFKRYVSSRNLSPDDYLFPSNLDPKHPMSSRELLMIFRSWEKKAQLPPVRRTPHSLRKSFVRQLIADASSQPPASDLIKSQMGHTSTWMTDHYIQREVAPLPASPKVKPEED